MGLGQYDSLGEYCGPHTASSVFLILLAAAVFTVFRRTLEVGDTPDAAVVLAGCFVELDPGPDARGELRRTTEPQHTRL